MEAYADPKDIRETDSFPFNWAPRLGAGETLVSAVVIWVDQAGTTEEAVTNDDTVSRVVLSGGNAGETAKWIVKVTTSGSRTIDEDFTVEIIDRFVGVTAPTPAESLTAMLTEAEAALHALGMGQQVKEVWRDGRRVIYNGMSPSALQTYIDSLTARIAALTATTTGALPRRRFIGVAFG